MTGLSDTHPEVERRMYEAFRTMPPWRKWKNLFDDYRMARALHATGLRMRQPGVSVPAIQKAWIQLQMGSCESIALPEVIVEPVDQEFQPVFRFVIGALDRLGIAYAIGGSVASSLFGASRMTRDADLTVEPFLGREAVFVSAFDPRDYYLSADAVREALRSRSTFNILHPATGYKIDIFVRKDDAFERSAFARRCPYPMPGTPDVAVQVHSPEDVVLFKLRWFRLGGERSEKQWTDVIGVLKTQGDRLDFAYLERWAAELGIADLLARIRTECAA